MNLVRRITATLVATLVLSGCFGTSAEDQALEAAVERVEAVGVPDGYRQESFYRGAIDTDSSVAQSGQVRSDWVPIEDGDGSAAAIDEFLIGQGYRRYWNTICLVDGNYSIDYVRSDMQLRVSMTNEAELVSVSHGFGSSLEAPTPPAIPGNEVFELPECPAVTE